jgi:hypothetical protein
MKTFYNFFIPCLVFEIFWPKTVCSPPSWYYNWPKYKTSETPKIDNIFIFILINIKMLSIYLDKYKNAIDRSLEFHFTFCILLKYSAVVLKIIDLINWIFDDVTSRVKLLKLLRVGLNFFEKFLKMLWVNWVLKRLRKIEFHIDNDMWFAR